jgi:hypothetical protein
LFFLFSHLFYRSPCFAVFACDRESADLDFTFQYICTYIHTSQYTIQYYIRRPPPFISSSFYFRHFISSHFTLLSSVCTLSVLMASPANLSDDSPDALETKTNNARESESELSTSDSKKGRSQLRHDFQPSNYSVICGRVQGKASYTNVGNRRLRVIAGMSIESYSQAGRKTVKSAIVSEIIATIRRAGGHFCEYKKDTDTWFEVGDHYAREKVGALLRDMLHTQYRSSAQSKIAIKKDRQESQNHLFGRKLVECTGDSDDLSTMSSCWQSSNDSPWPEYSMNGDFLDINSDDFSTTSSCWGSSKDDSLGFAHSLEDNFFDIDVF